MSLRHRALRACAALTQARGAAAACSSVGLDANAATALPSSRMLHSAPPQPPQVAPSPSPASQQRRGISAAAVLMAEAKGGPAATAGGSGGAAVSSTQGDAGAAPGEGEEELEWDSDEEAAAEAVGEAFERLIQAAFQLVQEGKPMEAEYVLVEGECCAPCCAWLWVDCWVVGARLRTVLAAAAEHSEAHCWLSPFACCPMLGVPSPAALLPQRTLPPPWRSPPWQVPSRLKRSWGPTPWSWLPCSTSSASCASSTSACQRRRKRVRLCDWAVVWLGRQAGRQAGRERVEAAGAHAQLRIAAGEGKRCMRGHAGLWRAHRGVVTRAAALCLWLRIRAGGRQKHITRNSSPRQPRTGALHFHLTRALAGLCLPTSRSPPTAARRALDILREHDEGFGPATAIASTRYASTLLAQGEAAEAQVDDMLWRVAKLPSKIPRTWSVQQHEAACRVWLAKGALEAGAYGQGVHGVGFPLQAYSDALPMPCPPAPALQLYTGRSIDSLTRAMETLATLKAEDEEEEAVRTASRLSAEGLRMQTHECPDVAGARLTTLPLLPRPLLANLSFPHTSAPCLVGCRSCRRRGTSSRLASASPSFTTPWRSRRKT